MIDSIFIAYIVGVIKKSLILSIPCIATSAQFSACSDFALICKLYRSEMTFLLYIFQSNNNYNIDS